MPTPSPDSLWKNRWLRWTLVCLAILGLILVALPYGIQWGLLHWLAKHGAASAEIGDVDYNPFTGRLVLHDLRAHPEGARQLALERGVIEIDYLPLFRKRIFLPNIELRNAAFTLQRSAEGEWIFGGLLFPPDEKEKPGKAGDGWGLGFGVVALENVGLEYSDPLVDNRLLIRSARVGSLQSWIPEQTGDFHLQMTLNEAPLELEGSTTPFRPSRSVQTRVQVESLPLGWLAPVIADLADIDDFQGRLTLEGRLEAVSGGSSPGLTYQGAVRLENLQGRGEAWAVPASATLGWDGRFELRGTDDAPRWSLDGTVAAETGRAAWRPPGADRQLSAAVSTVMQVSGGNDVSAAGLGLGLDGSLELAGLQGALPQVQIENGSLAWEGESSLSLGREQPTIWQAKGTLQARDGKIEWELPDGSYRFKGTLDGQQEVEAGNGQGRTVLALETAGKLALGGLTGHLPGLALERGDLGWEGRVTVDLLPEAPAAVVAEGRLAADRAGFSQREGPWRMNQESLQFQGRLDYATGKTGTDSPLRMTGDLAGGDLALTHARRGRRALRFKNLNLAGFELTGGDAVGAEKLTVSGIDALERGAKDANQEPAYVLRLAGLEIGQPRLGKGRLSTQTVLLEDLDVRLERTAEGDVDFGGWRGGAQEKAAPKTSDRSAAGEQKAAAAAGKASGDGKPWSYAVGTVKLQGKNRLVFLDRAVEPAYRWELDDLGATLEGLDSARPEQAAKLQAQATPGTYSSVQVSGTVAPFADRPSMDLEGRIEALELPPLTPYMIEYTGYKIQQGRLDVDLSWPVEAGRLDGTIELLLKKLQVDQAAAGEEGEITRQLNIPLPTALNLMRDGDGNIGLHIPVSGDLTSPDFSFDAIIASAIGKTLQKAVMSYYAPLGATLLTGGASLPVSAGLMAVRKLLDMSTTMRFDPLTFSPGSSALGQPAEQRLEQIAERLGNRPEVRLVLCGLATPADLKALRTPEAAEPPAAGTAQPDASPPPQEAGEEPPQGQQEPMTEEERQALLKLARERTDAVKAELVDQGIDAERLFFCAPDVQNETGPPPRVEIAI